MNEINDKIYKIVSEAINGNIAPENLNEELKLAELGINSMTLITILFEMETAFGFEIGDVVDDLEPPETIGGLVDFAKEMKEAFLNN